MFGKNLKRGLMAVAMSGAILTMTGCVSLSQPTAEEIATSVATIQQYESNHSFAWNIAKQMGITKYVKDAYLEEAEYVRFKEAGGDSATTKALWYGGATLLTGNPFSISSMLYLFAPSTDDFMSDPIYMGFLPKDQAVNGTKAFMKFQEDAILPAYTKAAEEMGFKRGTSKFYLDFVRPETKDKAEGKMSVKLGTAPGTVLSSGHETTIPSWISKKTDSTVYWAVGQAPGMKLVTSHLHTNDSGSLIRKDSDYQIKIEWLERFAKNLPDNAFVFVPSYLNGEGKHTPAYIADNKQKYFFVMPKSAEPK